MRPHPDPEQMRQEIGFLRRLRRRDTPRARELPAGTDPADLVFAGAGGGVVTRGTRSVQSRHNFRTYHSALTKMADPATELRPTAARVLKALRADSPRTADELVVALANQGRAIRPSTIQTALGELACRSGRHGRGGAGSPLNTAVQARLAVVVRTAEEALEANPNQAPHRVF